MKANTPYRAVCWSFAVAIVAAAYMATPRVQAQQGMAPGQAAAPTVEALLPSLLRTDMTGPLPLAAIKFGPEFWAALELDAGGRAQNNLFRRLVSGGFLFGVGPLDNVLGAARGEKTLLRWTAPKTLRARLILDIDEPNIQASIEGQVFPAKARPASPDPNSLLNQLEFVFFPLRMGGGQATLADMARRMTLVISGIAPGVTQTFTWELAPPMEPFGQEHAPLVVKSAPSAQRTAPSRPHPGDGFGGTGGAVSGVPRAAPRPRGPRPETIEGYAGESEESLAVGPKAAFAIASGVLFSDAVPYALSRAASNVGASELPLETLVEDGRALTEAYAAIEQISETAGSVTLDYRTSPLGRQEVVLMNQQGLQEQRIAIGPAPANGRALASWKRDSLEGMDRPKELIVLVRNSVPTPLGVQISEAASSLPGDHHSNEPQAVLAPGAPTVADVSVLEMSVAGDLLQVRARVASVAGPQGTPIVPPLNICITDEAGNVVKTLRPTPPLPGKDYVFAWDATNDRDEPVADGRYVLRLEARADSERGGARSELRYWIDVPFDVTQRRLAIMGPLAVETLHTQLLRQEAGQVVISYTAPQPGRLRAFIVDQLGRVVRHLLDETVTEGQHRVMWDGTDDNGARLPDAPYAVNFELDGAHLGAWWGVVALDELPPPDY